MVLFHIWGLNSCHLKVPHKLMLRVIHCGAPTFDGAFYVTGRNKRFVVFFRAGIQFFIFFGRINNSFLRKSKQFVFF